MKPIKKGMAGAVTRDGRKVTQLTWFEGLKSEYSLIGVLEDCAYSWRPDGKYFSPLSGDSAFDIFAPVEYEYQWLVKHKDTGIYSVTGYQKSQEDAIPVNSRWGLVSRIEESKREVK